MSDETPTHRRVMEKARAEIERLTAEPQSPSVTHEEARDIAQRLIDFAFGNGGEQLRFSVPARPDRDDDLRLVQYISDARSRDAEIERLTRELAETLKDFHECRKSLSAAEEDRDAARQERDALRAMMRDVAIDAYGSGRVAGHEDTVDSCFTPYGYNERADVFGEVADEIIADHVSRLSPPSAPAQDAPSVERCEECDGVGKIGICRPVMCMQCNGTGKARR